MSLVESLKSTRPRRQVLLAVGIAVIICMGLIAAYFALFHNTYAVLFSALRPADAATIVADLDKKKVPYQLKDGGATILAPANLVDATRLSVVNSDLPLKGAVGFELFNKSDIGLTEFAQKINYQRALQGELARTVMTMDAVDSARVHLSLPEQTIFREDRRPPKASVTVLPRNGRTIGKDAVWGIQRLIAAAVPDLEAGDVVVLDQHGAVISTSAPVAADAAAPVFAAPGPIVQGPVAIRAPETPHPLPHAAAASPMAMLAVGLIGLAVLLGGALLIQGRVLKSTDGRRLTAQQRAEYARRLRTLLEREDVGASNV